MYQICELDIAHFVSASGLAWQDCLEKTGVTELLTDSDMLSVAEKGIRGGPCQVLQRYAKENN